MPVESTPCPNRPTPYWLEAIMALPILRECAQCILLVADDDLNYSSTSDTGLSIFVDELAKIPQAPVITKVHRGQDASVPPENREFKFTEASLKNIDQVWLFGKAAAPVLKDEEFQALAAFMEAGGGVFATGDHEDLGYAMGGELLRVRKMRNWSSIPVSRERIDTVINSGPDRLTQFHDQSDEFPQRIFPHYSRSGDSYVPHELLRSPAGDIDVMPDHPHESVCLDGSCHDDSALSARYNVHGCNLLEFPPDDDGPLAPQIIATSISAGRFLTDLAGKPPTTPRCFGSISVWDGHKVGKGRIVCDSSWHHFVNINLDGTQAVEQPPNNRCGLRDPLTGAFTADFHQVAQYYRNIVAWITPARCQPLVLLFDLIIERYRFPLVEEWRPLPPDPCPWEPRVELGTLVEGALRANRGRGLAEEIVTTVLEKAELHEFAELVRPRRVEDAARADKVQPLVNVDGLRRGLLGSIFDAFAQGLPANPSELPAALTAQKLDAAMFTEVMTQAARHAVDAATAFYAAGVKRTLVLLEETTALRARQVASQAKTPKPAVSEDEPSE